MPGHDQREEGGVGEEEEEGGGRGSKGGGRGRKGGGRGRKGGGKKEILCSFFRPQKNQAPVFFNYTPKKGKSLFKTVDKNKPV